MPLLLKRKREEDHSSSSSVASQDGDFDISSALTGKRSKFSATIEEDDGNFADFIQASIAKRSIKEGTRIVKNAKGKEKVAKGEVGGGSFQSMGLHPFLLRSLTLQGYRIPTPIQRLSIPALLANPPRDLVGMARTGSGKSLAFLVPLVQRLGGRHSTIFGARALILLPTRELALQILKVGKELARGFQKGHGDHAGDKDDDNSKRGENLRWGLVVGGEGLDEQFEMISNNPDVIIATPGRLLHLVVEMDLDLRSVQYVVFDEADRLFEMGFQVALNEILKRLPSSRQTILFSATLPKSLVDFAKAGLQDPKLVRLDAESKISADLRMAFFSVKQAEKDACLLSLLRDVIRVPPSENQNEADATTGKKDGKAKQADQVTTPHQTLIFAATKHHVEYLLNLLTFAGYAVSHIYGSLDQAARTHQMDQFRRGITNILVVTDVAARGIDIPVLENVVNYDFPQGARVFVHRVGRTARAGRRGWAWSFVTNSELPYLLDLQLFLGRPLFNNVEDNGSDLSYIESLILGTFQRERVDEDVEHIRLLDAVHHSLPTLRQVMNRGHTMYERSKGKASPQSYRRAKEMVKDPKWLLASSNSGIHPVLLRGPGAHEERKQEETRENLLRAVNAFRPSETVFEVGLKKNSEAAALMKERRKALQKSAQRAVIPTSALTEETEGGPELKMKDVLMADEEDIVAVFGAQEKKKGYRDEEFYLSYTQKDAQTEKGYSLRDGASSFVKQAQSVTFDLTNDDDPGRSKKLTWDKKKKKFIQGDGTGADNVKMVRTENGTKLPATFQSGRFDEWKSKSRISLPRVGEIEDTSSRNKMVPNGRRFKHNKVVTAKPLDKLRGDYERKIRQQKRGTGIAGQSEEKQAPKQAPSPNGKRKLGVRRSGKTINRVKTEIKTAEQIRKQRKLAERRKAKNARPSRSGGKKRGRR